MPGVFISYVSENSREVNQLARLLRDYGVRIWLDRDDLSPGISWREAIRRAIVQGDHFMACFSREYNAKDRTHMNEELNLAIEELRLRPRDRTWFIPVRFSGEIPDWEIGGGRTLRDLQWIDITGDDWATPVLRILDAIGAKPPDVPDIEKLMFSSITDEEAKAELAANPHHGTIEQAARARLRIPYPAAVIEVRREKQIISMGAVFSILLDGTYAGCVASDDVARVYIRPGDHELHLNHYIAPTNDVFGFRGVNENTPSIRKRFEPGKEYKFYCRIETTLFGLLGMKMTWTER